MHQVTRVIARCRDHLASSEKAFRHRVILASAASLSIATQSVHAQSDSSWRYYNGAARAAYQRRDFVAYRAHLLKLAGLLSSHPQVVRGLAAAEALLGNADGALRWIRVLADAGLVADVAADSDFVSLRGNEEFRALSARLEGNRRPISRSVRAFTIPDPSLHPEDLTYDARSRAFYVSSMKRRKIVRIDASGRASDFVREAQDGIWSVLAVAVDPRARVLWATTSTLPQMRGFAPADSGRGALLTYDLGSGRLLARYDLAAQGGPHELGELAVDGRGDVYVSDGRQGVLYVLRRGGATLEPVVNDGTLASPQGIAVRPDGRLFVADYVRGIAIVDPATRRVEWLAHPDAIPLNGIDGLTLEGRSLLAVQNGTTPRRVVQLALDASLARVSRSEVLESNTAVSSEPTHGVVVDGEFYFIANSGFDRLAPDGSLKPGAVREAPVILRARLASPPTDETPAAVRPARDFASPLDRPLGVFLALSVASVDRMVDWYADRLGFKIVSRGDVALDSVRVRFALLDGDGSVIELIQRSDARPLGALAPRVEAYQVHGLFKAGLHVRDVDALHSRLRASGVPIAYPLGRTKDIPLRSFAVRDAEGNLLQFFGQ